MEPQLESEPSALRSNIITIDRPDSSQLVDLHVYIIPTNVWQEQKNLAENDAIEQAISAGFVRVPQNLTIYDLRRRIIDVCGQEDGFPKEFIYLRSVGRCLAKVKPQQELELRVKNYRPPITFAPEIYVLEGHHDEDPLMASNSKSTLSRESPIQSTTSTTTSRQESWAKSMIESPGPLATVNPSFFHSNSEQHNSPILNRSTTSSTSNLSRASSTLSARDLAKLREEQERLRLRQIELARQRREIEEEQQKRKTTDGADSEKEDKKPVIKKDELPTRDTEPEKLKAAKEQEEQRAAIQRKAEQEKRQREIEQEEKKKREQELLEKQKNLSKLAREKQEEEAATRIQASFRGYQGRRKTKQQKHHEHEAHELERLQKEARELARRKAEEGHVEEIKAHEVVKLAERLEKVKLERIELENNRETIIRRMQQLHAQIAVRRTEERDLWKQKYLVEKKKTVELEEKTRAVSPNQPDVTIRLEQAKIHLNNSTKLRQQAENECQLLKQELQQMRSSMNSLDKHSLPTQLPPQQKIPIAVDVTLQY